ncbi:MAG: hypothetical protein ACO3HF_04685 [Burkholderiaceae bacterium]
MTIIDRLKGLTVEIIRMLWDRGYYRQNKILKRIHDWWFEYWVQMKTAHTMVQVDREASQFRAQQAAQEDAELLAKAQAENPDAKVEVIHPFDKPDHKPGDPSIAAIKIEHEADGSRAQELLGGMLEIKAPWYDEADDKTGM